MIRKLLVVIVVLLSTKAYGAVVYLECPDADTVKQGIIQTLTATNCNVNQFYFYNSQGIKLGSVMVGKPVKADESCPQQIQAAKSAVFTKTGLSCQQDFMPHDVITCNYKLSNYVVNGYAWIWMGLQPADNNTIAMLNCGDGRLAMRTAAE